MRAMRKIRTRGICLAVGLALVSCSGYKSARQAQIAEQEGDWDQAVLQYLELIDQYPGNVSYRTGLMRAKLKASQMHFERAKSLHEAGALDRALEEYRQAVQLDPSNQYARVELDKLMAEIAVVERGADPQQSLDEMKERTRGARAQPPVLNPRSNEPISLAFPRPVSVQDIYMALGKAFGINILFDPKLKDQDVAIELEEVVAQDALEILMRTTNHFYKVLDEHTIIVVEDSPQNRRAYEDLVIQTFFLSNAEVKDVMTMLRSLVGAKNIAANDQLNAIVLRDSADKVKVAETIISTNDKSRGEVVVDVELLEIDTKKLQELGLLLSDYQITQFLDPSLQVGDTGGFRVSDLEFINQGDWLVTIPSFTYDFMKQRTEAQLLASPQVRISDGEKALLHIGDQVPIPVTTFSSANTIGGNIVPITSFQYQDIGIRLDIEPRIHHNKEITLKLKVEVSAITGFVGGEQSSQQPIIATRRIESNIRLKDGETNFLAGLIRTDETTTDTGIPGLMDIPVIGRIFTHKKTDVDRTDLILTLTPHIIRIPNIDESDLLPIWVGTEANITFRGGSPRVESNVEGPFDEEEDEDAERIREMIRRRIQNLPRGLQNDTEGQESEGETAPAPDLARPGTPGDLFEGELDRDADEESFEEDEPPLAWFAAPSESRFMPASFTSAEKGFRLAANNKAEDTAVGLRLQPSKPAVGMGEQFDVELLIDASQPVSHVPVTLSYDASRLEVLDVWSGEFLGARRDSQFMAEYSNPGNIVLGASRLGNRRGVQGKGTVAHIRFRAIAPGQAVVKFDQGSRVLDSDLAPIRPLSKKRTTVQVGSEKGSSASPDQIDDASGQERSDPPIRG
jgi:general secretion pathway protein D